MNTAMKTSAQFKDETIAILQGKAPKLRKPTPQAIFEDAFRNGFIALEYFAQAHFAMYNSPIGEDSVLGEAWLNMARGLVAMLDGEHGRLDAGTMWSLINDLAKAVGFEKGLDE